MATGVIRPYMFDFFKLDQLMTSYSVIICEIICEAERFAVLCTI